MFDWILHPDNGEELGLFDPQPTILLRTVAIPRLMYLLNPMNLNSRNQLTYLPCKNCGLPVKISAKYAWMIKDGKKVTANCCSPENPRVLGLHLKIFNDSSFGGTK